jgi:subtilase family serine protease
MALTTGVAQASPAPASSAPASSDIANLQAQVHQGTLLSSHGVRSMCASGCHADVVTTSPGSDTVLSTDTPVGLGATDLARAYSLPRAAVGTKGTIALISTGANTHLESDLATYRKQYGLPACTTASGCLTITDFHGGPPVEPGTTTEFKVSEEEAAIETSLDVDMASAACPDCHIMVVQTPDIDATGEPTPEGKAADYAVAYQTAVRLGANAVSLSDVEYLDSSTVDASYSKAVRHPGVPLFASKGDISSSDSTAVASSDAAASAKTAIDTTYTWPADLPWAVAVGGTSLKPVDASRTQFTETAWHGLNGECALALPPAAGQPASVAANCGGHRAATDVSAVADPASGPAVYDTYAPSTGTPKNWIISGGTSASSPFVAAWYVRSSGHSTGAVGPSALYRAPASVFHDVTTDGGSPATCQKFGWDEKVCQAGPGWDGPTGLGSPHGLGKF